MEAIAGGVPVRSVPSWNADTSWQSSAIETERQGGVANASNSSETNLPTRNRILSTAAPLATLAQGASKRADQKSGAQVQVPNRPTSPLFNSTQGKQKTEIRFDPATGMGTLKLLG